MGLFKVRRIGKVHSAQHGAIAVIFALILPALIAIMGIAIDFGYLYVMRSKLQDVADATALAGAMQMHKTEGRYNGSPLAEDKEAMVIGKAIADFVKVNDDSFRNLSLDNLAYKGIYRTYENGYLNEEKEDIDDGNSNFVKLMDFDCWSDSDKGPKLAADLNYKVEYAVSGRLNSHNFLDVNVDSSNRIISDFIDDDRVRVRLTKRVPLMFLNAVMGDEHAKGVVLTVTAAAKCNLTVAGESSGGGLNSEAKVPVIYANMIDYNNSSLDQLIYQEGDAEAVTVGITVNNNGQNYLPKTNTDNLNKYLSPGYYTCNLDQVMNAGKLQNVDTTRVNMYKIEDKYLLAQKLENGQYSVCYFGTQEYAIPANDDGYYIMQDNNGTWTPVLQAKNAASIDTIKLWITDVNRILGIKNYVDNYKKGMEDANNYNVRLEKDTNYLNSDNGANRIYGKNFDINNLRLNVNVSDSYSFFYTNVINCSSFNGAVLTDYHLAYNKSWLNSSTGQYTVPSNASINYAAIKYDSSVDYVKNIKALRFAGNGVIATNGVVYGDIYCNQNDLYIYGSNNVFMGNIYGANNIYIGGNDNHILAYPDNSASLEEQHFIYAPNMLYFNKGYSSIGSGTTPSEISVMVDNNNHNPEKIYFGNGNWNRGTAEQEVRRETVLVE